MKKVLFGLILGLFAISQADPPAVNGVPTNVNRDVTRFYNVSASTGFDTLVGVDSSTLYTSGVLASSDRGCGWYLVFDAWTGTGADSVSAQVLVDALDWQGNLLYRTTIDTIATASSVCPGQSIRIPVGETIFGDKFRVKVMSTSGAGAGTQQIINRVYIYKSNLTQKTKQVP